MSFNEKLTNIELKKDESTDSYYLDVTYEYEDDKGYYEMHIPHVRLPFSEKKTPYISTIGSNYFNGCKITYGDDELTLCEGQTKHMDDLDLGDKYCAFYTVKTLKEKRQEMTLEEVEKKLGYKIKIVSEKE